MILAPTGRDGALTCSLLQGSGMGAVACEDVDELCARYQRDGALGLMITEEALTPSTFRRLKSLLDEQETWSDLPVLIFRGGQGAPAARPTIAQLVNALGQVTLLDRPLQQITMLSAAKSASRSRKRQYAARATLEEQRLAVKQRDQFLAMLGHELRNPLATISLAVQMDHESDGTRHRGIIRRQARHLTRLVDDLLDVARVTSGKIALQRRLIDLREVAKRALEAMRPTLIAQELAVEVRGPEQPVLIDADAVRLEQVVVNLLGNAAKYTPAAGQVAVSVAEEGGEAVIAVRDNGVGMAPDVLPHVFDLFAQAERSLDRAKGGMGIGLTLVRRLVALHGGGVEAHSEGVGKGSLFVVRLPLAAQASASVDTDVPSEDPPGGAERDVLIVEDNEDCRELLSSMLERRGHRVAAAADGLTGVEVALRRRPEVILVDIGLPGLDGYGVARRVRSELGATVYLVALTGYGQPGDRARALAAGFDVHLTKPVDFSALQRLLARGGVARPPQLAHATAPPGTRFAR